MIDRVDRGLEVPSETGLKTLFMPDHINFNWRQYCQKEIG